MKKKGKILGVCLLTTLSVFGNKFIDNPPDTVIIEFGNNSRIIFVIDNRDDLEKIQQYDINAILKDLSLKIESAEENNSVLKIEDETGTKYLKDTTIVIIDPVVEFDGDGDEFDRDRIRDDDDDDDGRIRKRRVWPKTRQSFNIEIGTNNYLENGKFPDENNAPYAVRPWGSWYLALNTTYKTNIAGPLFIEWGGGIDWYNFKLEDDQVRILKSNTGVVFQQDTMQNVSGRKSKLTVSYLYLKAVPMLDFSYNTRRSRLWNRHGDGFRIGVGGYSGLRISSHTKFVFKQDGNNEKDKDRNNFFINNFRYGLRGQIGFRGIDLFINYDVSELFSNGRGPELNAFTFGFTL